MIMKQGKDYKVMEINKTCRCGYTKGVSDRLGTRVWEGLKKEVIEILCDTFKNAGKDWFAINRDSTNGA